MTRVFTSDFREARNTGHPDPFPVWKLKRVDSPTTAVIPDEIPRVDERESGFNRALRGDFGKRLAKERHRMVFKHPLSGALLNMQNHLADPQAVDGEPVANRAPATDNPVINARHIKETAYFLRSDVVGICELPAYSVYSHSMATGEPVNLSHKYAIAILVDQDAKTCEGSYGNDWISNSMSFMAYSTSGFIACILADYIRRLGYPARAHHARNYQVVVPPILLMAGLGEMSRIGDTVLNPFLGPRFKAAVVTTDLPLAIDKPIDFGLQDFCDKCQKCARECPSHSISDGKKEIHNGYEKWPNNVKTCTAMRVGNRYGSGCGVCVKVCPWSKPYTPFHRFVAWGMRNVPFFRRFSIWGDDLMGYGRARSELKWWWDLEDVDGEWRVPPERKDRLAGEQSLFD
jgi:reductive dehalogenase